MEKSVLPCEALAMNSTCTCLIKHVLNLSSITHVRKCARRQEHQQVDCSRIYWKGQNSIGPSVRDNPVMPHLAKLIETSADVIDLHWTGDFSRTEWQQRMRSITEQRLQEKDRESLSKCAFSANADKSTPWSRRSRKGQQYLRQGFEIEAEQ